MKWLYYELIIKYDLFSYLIRTGWILQDWLLKTVAYFLKFLGIMVAKPPIGLPVSCIWKFLNAGLARTEWLLNDFDNLYRLFRSRKCSWRQTIGICTVGSSSISLTKSNFSKLLPLVLYEYMQIVSFVVSIIIEN